MADARPFRFKPTPNQKNLHFSVTNPVTGDSPMISARSPDFIADPDDKRTARVFARVRAKCGVDECIAEVKPEPVAVEPPVLKPAAPVEVEVPADAPAAAATEMEPAPSANAQTRTLDAWIRRNLPGVDPDDMSRDEMKAEIAKAAAE